MPYGGIYYYNICINSIIFKMLPEVPNVLVIVTDGESNIDYRRTIPEAMALKNAGVSVITIAVGFAER